MTKHRRWLTTILLFTIVAVVLAACTAEAPTEDTPAAQASPEVPNEAAVEEEEPEVADGEALAASPATEALEVPTQFSEAPMLAEQVEQGELPPIEERLPKEPFVVGPGVLITEEDLPDWTPGRYGGTLRSAHSVAEWNPDVFMMLNEPLLTAPGVSTDGIRGNVVRAFEVNDDNTEFTFQLREGLKWSDGEPVTTEDVRFAYEDVLLNEQLTPTFPSRFKVGDSPTGEPMELEIVDDYTFVIRFPEPYGGFLRQITIEKWVSYTELLLPSHYLKQFHIDHAQPEEFGRLLKEAGVEEGQWWQLFQNKLCLNWDMTNPRCAGHPTLTPWIPVQAGTGLLRFERNPYYFKVDTEGQQLPYLDTIISSQQGDVEAVNLKVVTGEVDYLRESTALVNVPLYKENEERAGIRTILTDMHVNSSALMLNQTFEDETWREVVQDIRFRQAISHAINRQEIIDSVYYGFAGLPVKTVGEEQAQYDVERANQLLDEMGLDQRDGQGMRLGPDGQVFTIPVEHGAHAPDLGPVAEILVAQLRDVGLKMTVKRIDPSLWGERNTANELQATVFWAPSQGSGPDDHRTIIPISWSQLWIQWRNTDGREGEEPPDWVKRGFELNTQRWQVLTGSEAYQQIVEQELAWHRENLPVITMVENVKYPMIAAQTLGNVPQSGYAIAANFSGEQFFFTE